MSLNLSKGENVDIVKAAGGTLTKIRFGLGWDARTGDGAPFDLDASVIGLGEGGKSVGKDWFVYYNQLRSPAGEIVHSGDERTGDSEGDDEQIVVDLTALPESIAELAVAVTIHDAAQRGQNFGLVTKAYVRVLDESNGAELARFDLSEDGSTSTIVVFGKAYRKDGGWKFKALGETLTGDIQTLIDNYQIA